VYVKVCDVTERQRCICRVGQNRIHTPYMTVYLMISLPKYRRYTVYIYGSGQPYVFVTLLKRACYSGHLVKLATQATWLSLLPRPHSSAGLPHSCVCRSVLAMIEVTDSSL
jgi:hypothetical protein